MKRGPWEDTRLKSALQTDALLKHLMPDCATLSQNLSLPSNQIPLKYITKVVSMRLRSRNFPGIIKVVEDNRG